MKFGSPDILIYLSVVMAVLISFYIWAELSYRLASSKFAKEPLLNKIAPWQNKRIRLVRTILIISAVLFIGLAASRPQWGLYWKEKRAKGLDITIAVDVSKSMLADDVKPSRISFVKSEIKDFIKKLEGDRVAILAFAGDAFLLCPSTMDYEASFLILNNLNVGSVKRGGTSIPAAITEAVRSFKWAGTENKVLIIISDGENTEGDIREAIKEAKDANVRIFCIGVGTKEGSMVYSRDETGKTDLLKDESGKPVRSRLDEEVLKDIAEETGGAYIEASVKEFGLDTIRTKWLSQMKRLAEEAELERAYKERFQVPLVMGVIFLMVEIFLGMVNINEEE